MEEIVKMHMELMKKMSNDMSSMQDSVNQLSSSMENFVAYQTANQKDARLPSKTEANPKPCGVVTVVAPSEVNGVTTRTGKSTTILEKQPGEDGILSRPVTYVTPHLAALKRDP
jgi:hypothetical protein